MQKPIIPILVCLVLILGGAAAQGDSRKEARIHFEQGVELYQAGKIEESAIEFERAYELHPSYKILFNLAQAEAEIQHYSRALNAYLRYLKEGGNDIRDERRAVVDKEVRRLQTLVGRIKIPFEEEGATVMVDGERVAQTPLAEDLTVDVGKHEVSVIQDGRILHREVIRIAGRETVTVTVPVAAESPGPEPSPGQTEPEPIPEPREDAVQPTPMEQPLSEPEKPKRLWTWVAFGVGGAAALGAGVTGILSLTKKAAVEDDCNEDSKTCPGSLEGDATTVAALALTTDILIGTAVLGIGLGTLFYFIEPKFGKEKEQVALMPLVDSETIGLSFGRRF